MRLHFIPIHVFRETPSVTFFDAGVPGSNGTDVVAHHGAATSPPDQNGSEQYYVHRHQVDNNLVLEGSRTFTLLNPAWDHPHHIIHLIRAMGAPNPHRHLSPLHVQQRRSLVLNQSMRDQGLITERNSSP